MSEEQTQQGTEPAMSDEHRWGEPIPPERRVELEARLQAWAAESPARSLLSPFAPATPQEPAFPLTGADVYYLAARALAGPEANEAALTDAKRRLSATSRERLTVNLSMLDLKGAQLHAAHLEDAFLVGAQLDNASFFQAHLERAQLGLAHLKYATLNQAHLEHAHLGASTLDRADLVAAHLEGAFLSMASLERARLIGAHLEKVDLSLAHLKGADLNTAHLEGANLREAHLEEANLREAHLEAAQLRLTHLEGANLSAAHLERADLTAAYFDKASRLNEAVLAGVNLDQVTFDNTTLTVVDWSLVSTLGDERTARASADGDGKPKDRGRRLREYKAAVRANRVLAVALEGQGLAEDAARFAYRAQLLQQQVLWRQRKLGSYLFSRFLDAIAGYGYQPVRSLIAYLCVVLGFAAAYYLLGPVSGHNFYPDGALVFSLTSFHGRGFFPGGLDLENWVTRLAAAEAVIGLLIEISFIATFTQRFFGAK